MPPRKLVLLLFITALSSHSLLAQEGPGYWVMFFGKHKIDSKWSIHTELQIRQKHFPSTNEQLLSRIGLLHAPKPDLQIGGGYGFINNYSGKESLFEPISNEHRVWQQLVQVHKANKVKFEHRFRLEQRFLEGFYSNRIRYRLLFSVPIGVQPFGAHSFSFHTYNEVFLHDQSEAFDRNRLYAAISYHLKRQNQVQLGILRQDVGKQHHYYLQMAFILIH